jgi:two-component system, OmpR family, sensor histidine kinase PrrB
LVAASAATATVGAATRIALAGHRLNHTNTITITVDDNGRGLPAEEHENVLGRFARGRSAAAGGSGLGLALVVQQAALHGGNIVLSHSPLGALLATLTLSTEPLQDSTDQS